MKQILMASAVLAGALAFIPASAEAQRVGGSGGLGGGNFRSALGAGGVTGFGNPGFRGGGLGGGGIRPGGGAIGGGFAGRPGGGVGIGGGGFAGRPGFGGVRPSFGGVRPGFGGGYAGVRPGFGHHGWHGGNRWRNAGYYRRGYGYGGIGLGLGLGLAAGSLYGAYGYPGYGYGYDSGYYAQPGYYAPAGYYGTETVTVGATQGDEDLVAECARRFKTYDPQTQTYIAKRGVRRSCP